MNTYEYLYIAKYFVPTNFRIKHSVVCSLSSETCGVLDFIDIFILCIFVFFL